MMLQRTSERVFRVAHLFCGIGAGAKGFNDANPRVGGVSARFECAGGIDVDAGAIRNFERITGCPGTVMDLFDREQYTEFHGHAPPHDWVEASPGDIRKAFGPVVDVAFLSAPCKGFSGLLSAKASATAKYQALNRLTLRGVWLMCEAYKNDPIRVILFENPSRHNPENFMAATIASILRDGQDPSMPALRQWLQALSSSVAATVMGFRTFPTLADLNAYVPTGTQATYAFTTDGGLTPYKFAAGVWTVDNSFYQGFGALVEPLVEELTAVTLRVSDAEDALDDLKIDAVGYIGRPGDAVLVDGTAAAAGSVYWHDEVKDIGALTAVDLFDNAAGTINVAVYRGAHDTLRRVGLTTFNITGTGTARRYPLATPIAVRAGDILAIQPTDNALTVAEVQSGDVGYTYSYPGLPDTFALGAPTTNGQVQVRFVVSYRKQVVTADSYRALTAVKITDLRAIALDSNVKPRGYVSWRTLGQATAHTVRWGNTVAKLGGDVQRMPFPNYSLAQPYAFLGNSLTDSSDVNYRWSQQLAARYGQQFISEARYSSDGRMVYRSGAKPIILTLAGAVPANGSVAVTQINGAAIDSNNPAAFLTTGDPTVLSGMSKTGYLKRNGVMRRATVSASNGASFDYKVTQTPGQTAITFDGPVTFVPDFALQVQGRIAFVWIGNNFFFSGVPNAYGDYTNPQMWVDMKLIVDFLQGLGCWVFLLPVIPSSNTTTGDNWLARGAGTPYTAMESANARTEAMFPGLMAKHADGRTLLQFLQSRNDGSAGALDDVSKGFTPRNLRRKDDGSYDLLHMYGNGTGDLAVADFADSAVQARIVSDAITQTSDFVVTAYGAADQLPDVAAVRIARDFTTDLSDKVALVAARLDYAGLTIGSFTANPSIAEVGATITSTALAWTIAGVSPTVQTVTRTGGAGTAVTAADRAATVVANLTTDTTFTLISTDSNAPAGSSAGTKTATTTLRFRQKGHAGIIDKASGITSADANSMALSWWAESVARTLTTTAAAAGYLWYSQPSLQADPSAFKVNGFAVTPTKTLRNHITATGQIVQYADFLLSNRLSAGAVTTMEIFA